MHQPIAQNNVTLMGEIPKVCSNTLAVSHPIPMDSGEEENLRNLVNGET